MTANAYLDACGWIPTSSGTGTWTVSAAIQGYQTLAAAATAQGVASGAVLSYRAESADKSQWEEGYGASGSSNTTLARSTITANSSGGTTAISFSAAPNVYITALSADLQNASLLANGTVPTGRLGSGTANGTTVLFGDQTYGAAPRLLNTITASSNTPSDTTSLTSTFTAYDIVFYNILASTNAVSVLLQVQVSASFQTGSYQAIISENNSANATFTSTAFTNGIPLTQTNNANNTGPGISGSFRIVNPAGTTVQKSIYGTTNSNTNAGAARWASVSGFYGGSTAAVTGFQIAPSSGNITSGTIKVYGIP